MIRRLAGKDWFGKDRFGKIRPSFTISFILRVYGDGQLRCEERETLSMPRSASPHLGGAVSAGGALFLLAVLEPIAEYGSWAKTPLDHDSEEMIFPFARERRYGSPV